MNLAACRSAQPPPTAENEDVVASVTAAVMTAIAQVEGTPPATTLPTTSTIDAPDGATIAPVCRTLQELNFRFGPGLSYNPPVRALPPDTPLTPLAFSAIGYPGGQWIQVRDDARGDVGWVSAGSQFVACNIDATTLPPAANIPPTPTRPPVAASPTPVTAAPPRVVLSNVPGGQPEYVEGQVIDSDTFLLRMRVADTRIGNEDGAGIDYVEFFITTPARAPVYFRRENVAAYCIFGGGEPNCNPWPLRDGRYFWGGDGPEVQPGDYRGSILVYPQDPDFDGEVWAWNFDFTLTPP